MTKSKVKFEINLGDKLVECGKTIHAKLYGVTQCKPEFLEKVCPDEGRFSLYVPTDCYEFFYIVANVKIHRCSCKHKDSINLLAIFRYDECHVRLSEQVTVANTFCFLRFLEVRHCKVILSGKDEFLNIAYGMKNNFVLADGTISAIIQSNPNGLETNSYPLFNYLSNLIYYCYSDKDVLANFLLLSEGKSVVDGMLNLAQNPFRKVQEIYDLISAKDAIFVPALNTITLPHWKESTVPHQWTLTIKINDSGSKNFLMGGPAYLAFDKNNRAWVNNNTRQGTPNSSTFCSIYEPNGKASCISPLFGGGLLGAGFGITINNERDTITVGNFGWGPTHYNPQEGSVSYIKSTGKLVSPPNGFTNGVHRAQGVFYDRHDNLWICSWGSQEPLGGTNDGNTFDFANANSAITVYIKGNPDNYNVYQFDSPFHGTFDVVVDDQDNVYVSNAGNKKESVKSSVFHFRLIDDEIVKINSWISDHVETDGVEALRQINVGLSGHIYVAAALSSRVLKFDKQLTHVDSLTSNMDSPWGLEFDELGTMFVSNFRRETDYADDETFDMSGAFGVTVVYNEDENTSQLVTLPTGGQEVMLANGFPLYGSNSKPSYEPLMRLTGSKPDCIGNLWAVNNWKPALQNDFQSNPGGDGIVVFIGLARTHNTKN